MHTNAVLLHGPRDLSVAEVRLADPGASDVVVQIAHSGISAGTEHQIWSGEVTQLPGKGYPLVPGQEAVGEVVEAGPETGYHVGDHVFVPGASCYQDAVGFFGGAAGTLVSDASRISCIDAGLGAQGTLLALAATARHSMSGLDKVLPDLIVGHGVLGRLLARLTIAAGGPPPTVWETDPNLRGGAGGYTVVDPSEDTTREYAAIYDASGKGALLDTLVGRISKGGEIVLAGTYKEPLQFDFPPAFTKEARIRVAAECNRYDLIATRSLVENGTLSLEGLISHHAPASRAAEAYRQAFEDASCLKMVLDWKDAA